MSKLMEPKQQYKFLTFHNLLRFIVVIFYPTVMLVLMDRERKFNITFPGRYVYDLMLISIVLCFISALFSVKHGFLAFLLELVLLTCGLIASVIVLGVMLMALDGGLYR
ncbi:MAG: hypothetical protein PF692_05170 [Kiritimatiellae bacterium]|jgi:hypothetical protein|nr:hypothetical protein [Kiritimatiellia bacterium]